MSTSVYQLCSWWKEKKQTDRLTLVDVGGFYALFFLPTPASSWLVDFFFFNILAFLLFTAVIFQIIDEKT